jgi:hypothetical protein
VADVQHRVFDSNVFDSEILEHCLIMPDENSEPDTAAPARQWPVWDFRPGPHIVAA